MPRTDEPVTISADSLGEMLLKINRMDMKSGTVFIPDIETAEKIGAQLMHQISLGLQTLREQQRKEIIDNRLTFTDSRIN